MQEDHWALRYEGMEALLAYARSQQSGDFKAVLPKSVYSSGGCCALQLCTCMFPYSAIY